MGYTHYFSHTKISDKKWGKIVKDCKTLNNMLAEYASSDIEVAGWDGEGDPVFDDNEICFNGKGEELSHETFTLRKTGPEVKDWMDVNEIPFAFCKTARKPYDLLVCGCLLVYKHYSPKTIDLGSDGENEDWADAETFVKSSLGYDEKYLNKLK